MSTPNHNEYFTGANHFNINDLNIGIPAPSPPPHGPTYNNFGTMQQVNGTPNGGPVNMTQSGIVSNLGRGNAYQTPPTSWPGTPAPQDQQPAAPQVKNGYHAQSQPRTDRALRPPNPDIRENRTGNPPRPPVRPQGLPTPHSSFYPPAGVYQEEDDMYQEEEREGGVFIPESVATSLPGPPPRLRHAIFVGNGANGENNAKAVLENAMPDIRRLFGKAGLRNDEWIAQVGFNEEGLFKNNHYEEVIVFTILNPTFPIKSINRNKLKSRFTRFPIVIQSHTGKDRWMERGSGTAHVANTPAHKRETKLLERMGHDIPSISGGRPNNPDHATIAFTAETGISGLVDHDARLIVEASLRVHKVATGNVNGPSHSLEFSNLVFRMHGQKTVFFLKSAHVLVLNGENDVGVKQPTKTPRLVDNYKESIANTENEASTHGIAINASAKPGVILNHTRTEGKGVQVAHEQAYNHHWIDWDHLNPGMKVKYQYAKLEALESQFVAEAGKLPIFSISIPSSSATSTEAKDDIIKIRLTSFWTYRVDDNDVMKPEQVGALTRFGRRVTSWRSKESNPKSAPGFINLVHCVDLEVSTKFVGVVKDWKIRSPAPLDMTMDFSSKAEE